MREFAKVLLSVAGVAALSGFGGFAVSAVAPVPGVASRAAVVSAPGDADCAGGLCEVCPAVARVLAATGAQIYCIA